MPQVVRYEWWHADREVDIARWSFGQGRRESFGVHTQAYYEATLIESGRCWHEANGNRQVLVAGDVVFLRPDDIHDGGCLDRSGFTLINSAFRPAAVTAMRRRYPKTPWPWGKGSNPVIVHLDPTDLALIVRIAQGLPPSRCDASARDLLLLALVRAADGPGGGYGAGACPPWLRAALAETEASASPASLAAACGRSVTHVNRAVRRSFGTTTADLLLRRRLDRAAHALRFGAAAVAAVAATSGFANLAWFHRAFRTRFGCSPRAYREAALRPPDPT